MTSNQTLHPDFCPPESLDISSETGKNFSYPDLDFPPDPRLVAQGWERRFMADSARTAEATRLYTELGFEVHIAPIKSTELSTACGDCRLATCHTYVTVYTRKRRPS